ncbi:MAG: FixH family protein [Acidobacteriota bacterium]|nr:FixH family protein [Acidobacteriota bacterium]
MDLKVSPDNPSMTKPITFTLHIADAGQPVSSAEVTGTLTMKSMDMGKAEVKFSPQGNGDYQASMKELDMSGPWTLTVDAAQGSAHATKNFDFTVGD